jgi:uncharacterized membrane protein
MGHLLMMLLNKGERLLSEDAFIEFGKHHSIKAFEQNKNGYRLGVYPRFHKGREWLGHGGSINKYNSEFEYCHELGLGIFVVSNGPNATKTVDGILKTFHDLLPDASEKSMKSENVNRATDLTKLEGYYVFKSPRNQLLYPFTEFFSEGLFVDSDTGDIIISSLKGWESRLTHTEANSFSPSGTMNEYQYAFDRSNSPNMLYGGLGFAYQKTPLILMALLAIALMISFLMICLSPISLLIRIIHFTKAKTIVFSPQLTFEISALIFLMGTVLYLLAGTVSNIHEPQFLTIALFMSTILFPILTIIGIGQIFNYNYQSLAAKVWAICLATSLSILCSYLIYWGFFGFAMWSY